MPTPVSALPRLTGGALLALALAGCASAPPSGEAAGAVNDPLEVPNRFVFALNDGADIMLIRPAAEVYAKTLPDPVQQAVRNVIRNLLSPVIIANDLLRGDFAAAGDDTGRFMINTILGGAGAADVAEAAGLPYHPHDFGETLASWGVGEGPYLVLPLYGPSTVRDAVGLGVDTAADPLTYIAPAHDATGWLYAREGVSGIDKRAQLLDTLDSVRRDSLDYYASLRSLYLERRRAELGGAGAVPTIPDFPETPPATPPGTPPRSP